MARSPTCLRTAYTGFRKLLTGNTLVHYTVVTVLLRAFLVAAVALAAGSVGLVSLGGERDAQSLVQADEWAVYEAHIGSSTMGLFVAATADVEGILACRLVGGGNCGPDSPVLGDPEVELILRFGPFPTEYE